MSAERSTGECGEEQGERGEDHGRGEREEDHGVSAERTPGERGEDHGRGQREEKSQWSKINFSN